MTLMHNVHHTCLDASVPFQIDQSRQGCVPNKQQSVPRLGSCRSKKTPILVVPQTCPSHPLECSGSSVRSPNWSDCSTAYLGPRLPLSACSRISIAHRRLVVR